MALEFRKAVEWAIWTADRVAGRPTRCRRAVTFKPLRERRRRAYCRYSSKPQDLRYVDSSRRRRTVRTSARAWGP